MLCQSGSSESMMLEKGVWQQRQQKQLGSNLSENLPSLLSSPPSPLLHLIHCYHTLQPFKPLSPPSPSSLCWWQGRTASLPPAAPTRRRRLVGRTRLATQDRAQQLLGPSRAAASLLLQQLKDILNKQMRKNYKIYQTMNIVKNKQRGSHHAKTRLSKKKLFGNFVDAI